MKKVIFVFFLLYSFVGSGQTYVVAYARKAVVKKLPESILKNPEQIKDYLHAKERIRVYQLVHLNGRSKYTESYSMLDGVKDEGLAFFGSNVVVYKDFVDGFFLMTGKLVGPDRAVKERFEEFFNWTVLPKQDSVIAGFHCQKATTVFRNHVVVAWFTKDVPVMDGPGFYAGLPGLILQMQFSDSVVEVTDIQMIENKDEPIVLPNVEKYVSFTQYLKDRFKYFD